MNRHERTYLREQYGRVETRISPKIIYAFLLVWYLEIALGIFAIGTEAFR
ncbi:MAG TPA: hypothetical protein VGK23_05635 [Methanomassiliicoccales archaeon]